MEKILQNVYNDTIEQANELNLTQVMFEFDGVIYTTEFIKGRWTEPKSWTVIKHIKI